MTRTMASRGDSTPAPDTMEGGFDPDFHVAMDGDDSISVASESDDFGIASPKIFGTTHSRRIFIATDIISIATNYRPHIAFSGHVIEIARLEGALERALVNGDVVENELTLRIQYEPPSPKFKIRNPRQSSYRMKVSRGGDFVLMTRGFDEWATVRKSSRLVTWGNLEIAFLSDSDLSAFLSALKHVDLRLNEDGPSVRKPLVDAVRMCFGEGRNQGSASIKLWNGLQGVATTIRNRPVLCATMLASAVAIGMYLRRK